MRLTSPLRAQHLGWYFKKHWHVQGRRIPIETGAKEALSELNINVGDAEEIANESPVKPFIKFNFKNESEVLPAESVNVPSCFVYQDKHVLVEGLTQAKVLTNTIEITSMPKRIENFIGNTTISSAIDKNVHDLIYSSFVYDTEQKKLARTFRPDKPAHHLPRIYGITDERKCRLITSKLLFECEKLFGRSLSHKRRIVNDVSFLTSIIRDDCKIQFNIPVQMLLTSERPIEPFKEKFNADLPDIFPLKCTVSIPMQPELPENDFYPLHQAINCSHPHTVFVFYSPLNVMNLSEIPVTETQFQGRTFLAAFAAAASRAQQLYGQIKTLPNPIVVQSIQTDGKSFHFGIYQLNTLDLDNQDGIKNYWFHLPKMDLFDVCGYIDGRPTLRGYNREVFKYFKSIYQNN